MSLRSSEYRELKELADQLIAATDSNAYWLGPVRETSRELSTLLTHLLGGERAPMLGPGTSNWKCPAPGCHFSSVNRMDHPYPLTGCAPDVAGGAA